MNRCPARVSSVASLRHYETPAYLTSSAGLTDLEYLSWEEGGAMSLCVSCGLQLSGTAALCPHHHCVYGDDWAVGNRIMCDFFHRRRVPERLSRAERDDDFWAHMGDLA